MTSDRFIWAAEVLDVHDGDRLLEIGCGHGVLISEVCQRLERGTVVAIDRSAKMIAAAEKRNQEYVDAGMVRLSTATLAGAELAGEVFDKIYSFNVSLY